MNDLKLFFGCVVYIISPVDLVPEIILGPFGLADDALAALIAARVVLKYIFR